MNHARIPISSGIPATTDIAQHAWVKNNGSGGLVVCAANDDLPLGLTQDVVLAGKKGALIKQGRYTSLADGSGTAIAVDDDLMLGAAGKLVKYDGSPDAKIVARALEATSADGAEIDVLVYERWYAPVTS